MSTPITVDTPSLTVATEMLRTVLLDF